ncbi:hypothetical protein AMS68_004437 [Peltaster fructicola]|uniref:Myb-like domain-containing protein n=1 Tax=Peltaster fructicola TaxID=286661 RepID=A0A6H0XWV9_9PEZI|nr:hypothetical protein AMS68_004437 [Peltaster fructicola]
MAFQMKSSGPSKNAPYRPVITRDTAIDTPSRPRRKRGRPEFELELAVNGVEEEHVEIPETLVKTSKRTKRRKTGTDEEEAISRTAEVAQGIAQRVTKGSGKKSNNVSRHAKHGHNDHSHVVSSKAATKGAISRMRSPPSDDDYTGKRPSRRPRAPLEAAVSAANQLNAALALNAIMQSSPSPSLPSSPPEAEVIDEHSLHPSGLQSDEREVIPQSSLEEQSRPMSQEIRRSSLASVKVGTQASSRKPRIALEPSAKNSAVMGKASRSPKAVKPMVDKPVRSSRARAALSSLSRSVLATQSVPMKTVRLATTEPGSAGEDSTSGASRSAALPISSAVKARQGHIASASKTQAVGGGASSVPGSTSARRDHASGSFSIEEKRIIDNVFQQVLSKHNISEEELKREIASWRSALSRELRDLIVEQIPRRSFPSIRRYCQRHFHTAQRGPWTEAEDSTLRRAYSVSPDKWAIISVSVGRRAEDCRDRWRDFVSRQHAVLGPWSIEEENKLYGIVQELLLVAKDDAATNVDAELTVGWSVVSTKMGSTRSAKQCRERYQSMLKRTPGTVTSTKRRRSLPRTIKQSSLEQRAEEKRKTAFGQGDAYDALLELATCIPDRRAIYADPMTFWSICAEKNKSSRFTTRLRRRVFEAFSSECPQFNDLPPAEAAYQLCTVIKERSGGAELERKYAPTVRPRKTKALLSASHTADETIVAARPNGGPESNTLQHRAVVSPDRADEDSADARGRASGNHDTSDAEATDSDEESSTDGTSDVDGANAQLDQEFAASQKATAPP